MSSKRRVALPSQMYQGTSSPTSKCQPEPPAAISRRMRDEDPGDKHSHAPMERERQVESEGLFHPFEAGCEHHLHNQNGKSQETQGLPDIIGKTIVVLEVEPGS